MPKPTPRMSALATAAVLALGVGSAALVGAQPMPPAPAGLDLAQLPETRGVVARYILTPRGEVDGFLLQDGTQVHVPPHLSTQLVFAVKPGDAVAVRGLRALGAPMVTAVSVANAASGATVTDAGGGPRGAGQSMDVEGQVQATLRGARGEVNGAVLADGTILRLPPREAERFATLLQPGQTVAARGDGLTGPLGTVLAARQFGASLGQLVEVGGPPPPEGRGPRPPRG